MTKLARIAFAAVILAAVTTALILATLTWMEHPMEHPARPGPTVPVAELVEDGPAPEQPAPLDPASIVSPR